MESLPSRLWTTIGRVLAGYPQITELQLIDSPWLMDETHIFRDFRTPRKRLTIGSQEYCPPETEGNGPTLPAAIRSLTIFLSVASRHLVYLDVPGPLLMLPVMESLCWNSLRELRLHGYPPIAPEFVPLDWTVWLSAVPNLEALWVEFARSKTFPDYQFCLISPTAPKTSSQAPLFLANLHTLVLHRPSVDDHFFLHLPLSLRVLSLLTYPLLNRWRCTEDVAPTAPTCAAMIQILCKRRLPDLHTLRISVGDLSNEEGFRGSDLFQTIADRFPLLEVLELHCYLVMFANMDRDLSLYGAVSPYKSVMADRDIGS